MTDIVLVQPPAFKPAEPSLALAVLRDHLTMQVLVGVMLLLLGGGLASGLI